jgi:hypothetical protein
VTKLIAAVLLSITNRSLLLWNLADRRHRAGGIANVVGEKPAPSIIPVEATLGLMARSFDIASSSWRTVNRIVARRAG